MAFLDLSGLQRFKTKLESLFVKGPASATANRVATFDGTTGKVIKDSGYTIATSVPSGAVFTDTTYTDGTKSINVDKATLKYGNMVIEGTGTAGQAGSASAAYIPAQWKFNTGKTPAAGDVITIKIPVAGVNSGVWISIDNGTNYYPIAVNGTTRLTTQFAVNNHVTLIYQTGMTTALYGNTKAGAAAGASTQNVTMDRWCVLNYYDSNTTYSAMSSSEITTGTATTSRVMTAANLKAGLQGVLKVTSNDVQLYGAHLTGQVPAPTAANNGKFVKISNGAYTLANETTYSNATTSTAGLMSAADKTKLDGVATSDDTIVSNIAGVKSVLKAFASNISVGESKLVRIVHTNDSDSDIMEPNVKYSGYLTKNDSNNFSWLASGYLVKEPVIFSYYSDAHYWVNEKLAINSELNKDIEILGRAPKRTTCATLDAVKSAISSAVVSMPDNSVCYITLSLTAIAEPFVGGDWITQINKTNNSGYSGFATSYTTSKSAIYFQNLNGIWVFDQLVLNSKLAVQDLTITPGTNVTINSDSKVVKTGNMVSGYVKFTTSATKYGGEPFFDISNIRALHKSVYKIGSYSSRIDVNGNTFMSDGATTAGEYEITFAFALTI